MNSPTRRFMLLAPLALSVLCGLMIWSLQLGSVALSWRQAFAALGLGSAPLSGMLDTIVVQLRVPRALLAALTGAGLAMTGALLQTTTRNELADPFLFGLSSGASAGAVLVITRFGDALGVLTLPLSAFVGGILSAMAVMILFRVSRVRRAEQLIVCGLAVSFLFSALTSYLVFSGDQRAAGSVLFWSLGGLGLARWDNLFIPLVSFVLLAGFTALRWRALDALLAGEQTAHSMGVNVARLRTETFLCCALSTAFLVSLTGVIGFVGLMVPYLARRLVGVRHRLSVPMCGMLGAMLLTGGDMLSRSLIPNQELPIGIITAGLGARSSCPCCCARSGERRPVSIELQMQALLLNQRLPQVFRPAGLLQRRRHGMFQILTIAAQVDMRAPPQQAADDTGVIVDGVLHVILVGGVAREGGDEPREYARRVQRDQLLAIQEVFIAPFLTEDQHGFTPFALGGHFAQ